VAQKVNVQLVDDIDGSEAESTVEFGLDGVNYAIDLSVENSDELREALAPFVDNARRAGGRKRPVRTAAGKTTTARQAPVATAEREQKQAIREWARTQGWQVADRGRIPADILDKYNKAHKRSR
jgi:hypothetical protein